MIPACSASLSLWDTVSLVTPISLTLVTLGIIALLIASVLVMAVDAFARRNAPPLAQAGGRSRRLSALWLLALFLVVFSARLFLMRETPVTSPFWDQWDGEAVALFIPVQHCTLAWPTMFALHNEHRVFFTRLLSLDLVMLNGQWDPRLEQVVDAIVDAFIAVLVATGFWRAGGCRRLALPVLVCALVFSLPFTWENALVGFQSAFYFLVLFSVLALWLTTMHPVRSAAWWLGWACAACGIFTAASGALVPLAIAPVLVLKLREERGRWRDWLAHSGAVAAVLLLGFLAAAPPLAYHAPLKAKTVAEFFTYLGRALSWPWLLDPWLSLIVWLPVGVLLAAAIYRRGRTTALERLVVGWSLWVLLHGAALAYGRAGDQPLPATRYMDFLSLGFVANSVAIAAVGDRLRAGGLAHRLALGVLVGWLAVGIVGLDRLTRRALAELTVWRQYFAAEALTVRQYVITANLAELISRRPQIELPYVDANRLGVLLRDRDVRRILPPSLREPIPIAPLAVTNQAFAAGGSALDAGDPLARVWGSYAGNGRADQGRFDSQLISCTSGGRLRFQVAGYLGRPHHSLTVRDSEGHDQAIVVSAVPGDTWTEVIVPCPRRRFSIIAIDDTPDSWFAFREPVEIGWGSIVAEWLIAKSSAMLLMSLAMVLLTDRMSVTARAEEHAGADP